MPGTDCRILQSLVAVRGLLLGAALVSGTTFSVFGFPPAPYHEIYGQARDELGNPLDLTEATVTLIPNGKSPIRTLVAPSGRLGVNYRLRVPMESGIASLPYHASSMRAQFPFQLYIDHRGQRLVPIEVAGKDLTIGDPAGRTRLDLTLGVDLDGDGLPDAWERRMDVDGVDPGDDLDGDGISNWEEYIAGTYAFDPTHGFALDILDVVDGYPVVEFQALAKRTYVVQSSTNLSDWYETELQIEGGNGSWESVFYSAQLTHVRARLRAAQPDETLAFFRLVVQ